MLDENIEKSTSKETTENIEKVTEKIENIEPLEKKKVEVENSIEEKNDVVENEQIEDEKKEKQADEKQKEVPIESAKKSEDTNEKSEENKVIENEQIEDKKKEEQADEKQEKEPLENAKESEENAENKTVEDQKSSDAIEEKSNVEEETTSETAHTSPKKEEKEIPIIDYAKLTLDELVVALQNLDEFPIHKIKQQFEGLKSDFTKKFKTFIAEKKETFIKEGGNEIDFSYFSPVKDKFNEVTREYKRKRQKHYKDIENEQKDNLVKKLQIIEDLKDLIDNAEPSTMYKNFRALQDEWRSVGQIPHTKYNDVWRTYHHHVERFYDLLHLSNDFRDLDFKHNLEEKTKLIAKVEKLAEQADVNHAFKELQILHRMWKEDIGPVARDVREDVWDRFSAATKKIHDRRHEFQNQLDTKFKENVNLKLAVIEKIKTFSVDDITSHKSWQEGIKNMEKLRNEFFKIGRVPRSKNEEVWQLFKDATRNFNKNKNTFYKSIKKDQLENLAKKMQLVEQAESLKESDDWGITTEVFKKIQGDWKKIGHVPRRDSDKIWKKFKDACNHYFDKLHDKQDGSNKEQVEVFNKKKDLIELFKKQVDEENELTLELVNKYISDWKELGAVPMKMRHIESKFNKVIDAACKKLNMSKDDAIMLKFKNVIDTYVEQNDTRKIDNEMLFIRRKSDEITKEIKQLENNISFISNASKDNPLVKNVYRNIEKYNVDLKIWQKKMSYLKQLDY